MLSSLRWAATTNDTGDEPERRGGEGSAKPEMPPTAQSLNKQEDAERALQEKQATQ